LMEKLKEKTHSSGFTLAPEAATERMRNIINKPISTQQLLDTAYEIYKRQWTSVKLYFMIGHPSETLDDVKAIADLCKEVLAQGIKAKGRRASLHVGVSTFIPKPHTPFQWVTCDTPEQIELKQKLLRKELNRPGIKINWSAPPETLFEAWLSRGDRRLGKVIYRAWQLGAKFDAWQDQFNESVWKQAFIDNQLNPDFYIFRQRDLEEIFPWDHISTGVTKKHLKQDYLMSLEGKTRTDCREKCYSCGILSSFMEISKSQTEDHWKCPEIPMPSEGMI